MVEDTTFNKQHVYVGTGDYEVSFLYDVAASIVVEWIDPDGVLYPKINGSDYSIVTVSSVAYIRVLIDFGTGGTLSIRRELTLTQPYNFVDGEDPPPSSIMRAIDRVVWICQQIYGAFYNSLKAPDNETTDMTIPSAAARADGILGFGPLPDATPITFSSVPAAATSAYVESGLISANEAAFHEYFNLFNKSFIQGLVINNWVTQSIADGDLAAICYSDSLDTFVVVGYGATNNAARSNNGGDSWTSVSITDGDLRAVCWAESLGLFIAAGGAATANIQTSDNGFTWTPQTVTDSDFTSIAWSESLGMAVALGPKSTNNIQYSTTGLVWTAITTDAGSLMDVCWAETPGLFVAVGTAAADNLQYSSDGINWTSETLTDSELNGICYSESLGMWVAVGSASTLNVQYSTNLIDWIELTVGTGVQFNNVVFSERLGLFAAISSTYDGLWYSPDGITWTYRDMNDSLSNICWSERRGMFMTVSLAATNNIKQTLSIGNIL